LHDGYAEFKKAFEMQTNRAPGIDENTFGNTVSMESFIQARDRFGGPAPTAMDEAIDFYIHQLSSLKAETDSACARTLSAHHELDAAFQQLLEL